MLTKCMVCGKPGDRHHVIHKAEGGMETPLNYIYLCPEHHRGPMGPHRNSEVDLYYKIGMQEVLESLFPKKYYTAMEVKSISELSISNLKKFMVTNRLHKEGYDRNDIIFYLMGGTIYRHDQLLELNFAQL
ncbi:MAG: HNH endonuclease signature motif containing protein [Clostridiaceae bacterium]